MKFFMMIKGVLINVQTKPIFFKSYDSEFSPSSDLIGGFLSALNIFAKGISQDQIKAVIMGKMKYYNYSMDKKSDLNLVIISDESAKDTDLEKIMGILKNKFLKKYKIPEIIANMCQPSYFDNFGLMIDSYLQKINQMNIEEAASEIAEELLILPPLTEKLQFTLGNVSLPFLFKFVKDLGKVIYALFIKMRVVVTGEPSLVKLIIDTLRLFSPYRVLKLVYWTETLDESADVIGVPPDMIDLYIDSTIVNLEKNTTEGLKENKFFEELVKNIKKMDASNILLYIGEKINYLNKKSQDLAEIINLRKVSDDNLKNFNKDIDLDTIKLLETYFYWNYPKYTKKIKKVCENAKSLFLAEEFL